MYSVSQVSMWTNLWIFTYTLFFKVLWTIRSLANRKVPSACAAQDALESFWIWWKLNSLKENTDFVSFRVMWWRPSHHHLWDCASDVLSAQRWSNDFSVPRAHSKPLRHRPSRGGIPALPALTARTRLSRTLSSPHSPSVAPPTLHYFWGILFIPVSWNESTCTAYSVQSFLIPLP